MGLRNVYSLGKKETEIYMSFLQSRGHKMPDETYKAYYDDKRAKWYDALELMDFDI